MTRRIGRAAGVNTEAYRVLTDRVVAAQLRQGGFRIRSVHRQFVLPIALHKAIGSLRFTRAVERLFERAGLLASVRIAGHDRRRTVRVLVTGATGFTGGHLARALARRGQHVRALVRSADRAADLASAGIDLVVGDLLDADALARSVGNRAGDAGPVDVVYHIAAIYRQAGIPTETYRAVNATAVA